MSLLSLFLYMLRASLLSTGGFGNVSSLHSDFVPTHVATDSQFVQALTVGQLSPGPNGLWVISLGYLMLGPWGSLAALVAITIPPCLVIGIDHLYAKVRHHPAVEGLVRGLMLAVIGTVVVVLARLLGTAHADLATYVLLALAFGLGWFPRIPVVAVIGFCGLIGYFIHR